MVGTFIWTPENYLHAKYYLKTGLRPPKITESQWKRLHPRFKNLKLEKNVLVSGNKVILPDKKDIRDKIMMKYYLDPELNCQDPLRFWERLSERYIGLSVNEVRAFLQNQRAYQIVKRRPTHRERAITPIITDHRNQQIQCDFIVYGKDIKSHNSNNSYIFTVIDHFSKRAWAYPMKSRDQKLFVDILHIIFDENGFPTTLHADNEFKGGLLEQFLKENYVRLASSEPYHPQSHGCIERFNQTLRRDLKRMQILFDSKKWSDLVQKCVDNYNNRRHSSHGFKPIELYNTADIKMLEKARERLGRYRDKRIFKKPLVKSPIPVGTRVRLSLDTFPEVRKNKFLTKKGYLGNWSNLTYTVTKHIPSDSGKTANDLYIIDNKSKLYTSDQLQIANEDQTIPQRPTFNVQFDKDVEKEQKKRKLKNTLNILPPVETRAQKKRRITYIEEELKKRKGKKK